jgi:hypothetical protein
MGDADPQPEFIREMTLRIERGSGAVVAELSGLRGEIAGLRGDIREMSHYLRELGHGIVEIA